MSCNYVVVYCVGECGMLCILVIREVVMLLYSLVPASWYVVVLSDSLVTGHVNITNVG